MTASQPKRRNVNPAVASAKCRLAALVGRNASQERIDAARAELEVAKADAAVRGLLSLPFGERAKLANLLLTGGGVNAA